MFVSADPVTASSEVRSDVSDDVDAFVTERMQAHGIPGAAVAVVRGGEVVHLSGYGEADAAGRPVTADTPFLIASVSKPFTSTAVLQLVEDGRLSLDEPVLPYLDGIVDDVPAGFEHVTVEQLLTHTSGMGFLPGTAGAERIHHGDDALERRVSDVLTKQLSADPGTQFSYSNGGYSLLAAVIEQATGSSYDTYMREQVFDPLGMTSSFASDLDPRADDLATGHSRWFGQWRPRELPYDRAGAAMGYIGSSAADLTAFVQAYLGTDHEQVVSPRLRDLAHRPAAETGMNDATLAGYGMGWFVGELAGHPTVSHTGELGNFTAHVDLVPDADRLGVVVLANASAFAALQGGNYGLGSDLTRLLVGQDVEPASSMILTTGVLPFAVWAAAIGILIAAGRYLLITLPRLRASAPTGSGIQRWVCPVVLPALGYVALALPLLPVVPLGMAHHFAPDIGWGLTVMAYLALGWAALRTLLAISAVRTRPQATTPPENWRPAMSVFTRRIPRNLLATVLAVLTFAGVAVAGMTVTLRDISGPAPTGAQDLPAARASSEDGSIAVAVVLGQSGTVGSDVLAPYEVFASSPTFSVYTVAESAEPAPIAGGPALLPAHTFADVDSGTAPTPDVVVVPAVAEPTGEREASLRAWIVRQSEGGAHIFGVCAGSRLLAATGLLDGRRATSHWGRMDALEKSNPEVEWIRGQRYVQDGAITTTAGITSGIPGALKVVQDLAGPAEAERVGRSVNYPGWSLDASSAIPEQTFATSDLPVGLALTMPWFRPTVGIGLTDGVGEIDLAAAFEVYTASYAARAVAVAPQATVTTRHGVVLLTTPTDDAEAGVDRLIVPGAASADAIDPQLRQWATDREVDVEPLHDADGELGFDAALEHLADHFGRGSALTAAKAIDYPTDHLDLADDGPVWRLPALLSATLLFAIGVGVLTTIALKAVSLRRAIPPPVADTSVLGPERVASTSGGN
ncbi:MAG TPA: serine hydrolase [Euzebyales bacterium]|nr:serine hydrolase [Euzebyales bacterium]